MPNRAPRSTSKRISPRRLVTPATAAEAPGIGVIPWSPLCRGFLGRKAASALEKSSTRAQSDNVLDMQFSAADVETLKRVEETGKAHGCSNAQIATAWADGAYRFERYKPEKTNPPRLKIPGGKDGVRLLAKGELTAKTKFVVAGASKGAIEAVEKAGGSVTIVGGKTDAPEAEGA